MTDIERMLREVINQQKEQELMDQRIWIVDLVLADQAALFRAIQEGRSTMVAEGKECCHDRPQISQGTRIAQNRQQAARSPRTARAGMGACHRSHHRTDGVSRND
jgi:hypothetical protein